jgi:hypothetical protein
LPISPGFFRFLGKGLSTSSIILADSVTIRKIVAGVVLAIAGITQPTFF